MDLVRELKKLCNMNVTVILIIAGVLGMAPKTEKIHWDNWRLKGES